MVAELVQAMVEGDPRALARLITLLEREREHIPELMKAIHPHTGRAYCIGVTGPPGAGKSTLVDGLTQLIRCRGLTVGILAVDPTSTFTGGAVLGDRIRMQRHYLDQGVFIRSLATRGSRGGLSRITRECIKLLDAFGKDIILVETIGVGQTELDIIDATDTVVVVLVPEGGDAVQTMKAGLMEIGDVFVVNKADREGAGRLVANLKAMLRLNSQSTWWKLPIVSTQAHKSQGIEELYEGIERHRAAMEETSHLAEKRRQRQRQEFMEVIEGRLEEKLSDIIQREGELNQVMLQVERGEIDPYSAAAQLLENDSLLRQWLPSLDKRD